jgi:hypothetical protein
MADAFYNGMTDKDINDYIDALKLNRIEKDASNANCSLSELKMIGIVSHYYYYYYYYHYYYYYYYYY